MKGEVNMGRYDKKVKKSATASAQPASWCPACIIICSGSCAATCTGTANMKPLAEKTISK